MATRVSKYIPTLLVFVIFAVILLLIVSGRASSFIKNVTPPQTCVEAKARYLQAIDKYSPLYNPELDADNDGLICE